MLKLGALVFLLFLWAVYGVISAALIYHFKRYALKKSYLGLVVIFIGGNLFFFLGELVLFFQINWQEIQEVVFSFT